MAPHSSTIAWKIPWMEEPGRLYSPRDHKESDTTERLHFVSRLGEIKRSASVRWCIAGGGDKLQVLGVVR